MQTQISEHLARALRTGLQNYWQRRARDIIQEMIGDEDEDKDTQKRQWLAWRRAQAAAHVDTPTFSLPTRAAYTHAADYEAALQELQRYPNRRVSDVVSQLQNGLAAISRAELHAGSQMIEHARRTHKNLTATVLLTIPQACEQRLHLARRAFDDVRKELEAEEARAYEHNGPAIARALLEYAEPKDRTALEQHIAENMLTLQAVGANAREVCNILARADAHSAPHLLANPHALLMINAIQKRIDAATEARCRRRQDAHAAHAAAQQEARERFQQIMTRTVDNSLQQLANALDLEADTLRRLTEQRRAEMQSIVQEHSAPSNSAHRICRAITHSFQLSAAGTARNLCARVAAD